MISEVFAFDIETCSRYSSFMDFELNDPRGAELFNNKFNKMGWDSKYDSINTAYLENASIISTYGNICCISSGYTNSDNNYQVRSYCSDNEMEVVNSFNELLKKVQMKAFILCGFRIFHFDIPWILHKLHKYNIEPAEILYMYDKKPWECRIIDLSDDWKQKFAWNFSFDEMCYELDIESPKDNMNGSMVNDSYHRKDFESIKDYCEKDVIATLKAAKRIYKHL